MKSNKYQNKYRITTIRAGWHDYNCGAYFVTICTHNRVRYFGDIYNSQMMFSDIGRYADEQFSGVTDHYKYAEIPLWVIMPDHIHAIINITDPPPVDTMCTSYQNGMCVSYQNDMSALSARWKGNVVDEKMQMISHKRGRLSTVVGGLKRAITHYANENNITFVWQKRFHEHIIRNQNELERISKYIENNVVKWPYGRIK